MIVVTALAVVTAPLPFLGTVWLVAIGLFVAGIACSPVLISGMALIERIVPSAPADRIDGVGEFRARRRHRDRDSAGRGDHRPIRRADRRTG